MLDAILDNLGALSAKAQALKQVITNSLKFNGTDHRIYIKVKDNKALGFIKVGEKNLFYRDFVILSLHRSEISRNLSQPVYSIFMFMSHVSEVVLGR